MVSFALQIYPSLHAHSLRSLHGRSVKPIFTKIRSGGAEISSPQETAAPREFKKEEGVVSDHDSDDDGDGMMMEKVMMGRVMMMMMMMMIIIMTTTGGDLLRLQASRWREPLRARQSPTINFPVSNHRNYLENNVFTNTQYS